MKTLILTLGLLSAFIAAAQVEFKEDGVYMDGQFISTRLCDATNNYVSPQQRAKFTVALNKWENDRTKELADFNTPVISVIPITVSNFSPVMVETIENGQHKIKPSITPEYKNGLRYTRTNFAWRGMTHLRTNSSPVDARVHVRPEKPR